MGYIKVLYSIWAIGPNCLLKYVASRYHTQFSENTEMYNIYFYKGYSGLNKSKLIGWGEESNYGVVSKLFTDMVSSHYLNDHSQLIMMTHR